MRFATLLTLFFLAAVVLQAPANAQQISFSKKLCQSDDQLPPETCQPPASGTVHPGQAVFYVVAVQNLGPGPATINVSDTFPSGFVQSGVLGCTQTLASGATSTVTWPPSGLGSFAGVPAGATILCEVPGSFSNPGNSILTQTNSVQMSTGPITGTTPAASSTITVDNQQQLNVDLSLLKTASPASLNITNTTSGTVTYTITITNNGPGAASLGPYFQLHDVLALKPLSGALNVTLLPTSQTCTHYDSLQNVVGGGSCLVPTSSTGSTVVGTMSWQSFADWTFGSGNGFMAAGDSIVLTYTVQISQPTGVTCTPVTNAGGLLNGAYFDLQRQSGVTLTEVNPGNNSYQDNPPINTSSEVDVTTNYTVDPNCVPGGVVFKKVRIPASGNSEPWGPGNVNHFQISIQNNYTSPITVQLEDYISEGIAAPPFTSHFISSNPLITGIPFLQFTWYGQTQKQWPATGSAPFTLPAGASITIDLFFEFNQPDCDEVPNVTPKPISNIAKITYTIPGTSTQAVQYATAVTNMAPPPPCHFVVTKQRGGRLIAGTNPVVHFGGPLIYGVTFANQGPAHTATLLDTVRLTDPSYAPLPFTANWSCTASSGVTGYSATGGVSNGAAVYTSLPAQGALVMQMGHVFFPTNGTLTCTFTFTVNRPAFTDPNCSSTPTYFENMALMDETWPYNVNVPFPPSGTYVLGATSPSPQIQNWATVDIPLPKCFDAQDNKIVTANGLPPGSLPWTSPLGPSLKYQVNIANPTNSPLTGTPGSPWNGLVVTDTIQPTGLAANVVAGSPPCSPLGWCASSPSPLSATTEVGIQSIPAHGAATWNMVLNPQPAQLVPGTSITNCSTISPAGTFTGPDWYSYYDPAHPPASLSSCVTVPVLNTATLTIIKDLVDKTNPQIPATTTYNVTVNCSPYQATTTSLQLTSGAPGQSITVPATSGESCTVTESQSSLPPLPHSCKTPTGITGPGFWELPAVVPAGPIAISTSGQYTVHVLNVASCIPRDRAASLTVEKEVTGPSGPVPTTAFPITVTCNGTVWQPTPTLSNNGLAMQFLAPNVSCTVNEVRPTTNFPTPNCPNGGIWDPPAYSPSQTITTSLNHASLVVVTNHYHCQRIRIGVRDDSPANPK